MLLEFGWIVQNNTWTDCPLETQARRLGRFVLFEEQNSTETISFSTGLSEGVVVRPGQVIEVSDPVRAGLRRGGRISSATTTTVTVDNTSETDLDSTNNPTLSVVLPDGTVEKKSVLNITGSVITVTSAFSTTPNSNSVWILENTTLETSQWRVISISEDKDKYSIVATSYKSGKYAFIEDGTALPVRNITILNQPVPAPSNPTVVEEFFTEGNRARTRLNIDFNTVPRAIEYELRYQVDNGNFKSIRTRRQTYQVNTLLVRKIRLQRQKRSKKQPKSTKEANILI